MEVNGNGLTVVNGTKSRDSSSDNESEQGSWKNVRCGRRSLIAWALFSEYSENSTLHGVKYLGEKKLHWSERFFWIITFILSSIGSYLFIMEVCH